jgi:hypothetical protein
MPTPTPIGTAFATRFVELHVELVFVPAPKGHVTFPEDEEELAGVEDAGVEDCTAAAMTVTLPLGTSKSCPKSVFSQTLFASSPHQDLNGDTHRVVDPFVGHCVN